MPDCGCLEHCCAGLCCPDECACAPEFCDWQDAPESDPDGDETATS